MSDKTEHMPEELESALRNALAQAEYWKQLCVAARPFIEQAADISGYGFYRPANPHDFHPDHESCTDEEVANHKAACEAFDRGEYKPDRGDGWVSENMHILTAPWGIGSYSDVIPEAREILDAIARATGASNA